MKTKLLMMGGYGWAATSPLTYTLQRKAKYCHVGYTKYFRYLERYFNQISYPDDIVDPRGSQDVLGIYQQVLTNTYESNIPVGHRMNLPEDMQPLRDFPIKHLKSAARGFQNISGYVSYYKALSEHVVSKGYKSVADFYTPVHFDTPFSQKLYSAIKENFDVKIIYISRDPIRRAFSQYLDKVQRVVERPLVRLWRELLTLPANFPAQPYVEHFRFAQEVFGKNNVHMTVMEELWEGDGSALDALSKFLDHPIPELWKNLYSPDRGHLLQPDTDVACQGHQYNMELTPETYWNLKKKYQHHYDHWEYYFGSLPSSWGKPIDYR